MNEVNQDLALAIKLIDANEIANRFGFNVEFKLSEIQLNLGTHHQYTVNSIHEYFGFLKGFEERSKLKPIL